MTANLGIVIIGRNEGERLRRCLQSLAGLAAASVYVDSGSTDGSVALAKEMGARVIELDLSVPFTAARARNAGLATLRASMPGLGLVQFVDGDCELEAGWLDAAQAALRARPELAVVFGRRRERAREASIYNRACDLEWDVPVGDVQACGGDSLMRAAALIEVAGFDESLIAGEEPELCQRLRARGWHICRIDAPMTIHDAAMQRFGQWWRRAVRAGYVEAEGVARQGAAYPRRRQVFSHLFWVFGVPLGVAVVSLVAAQLSQSVAAALLTVALMPLAYVVLWQRIRRHARTRWPERDAACFATFCVLAKWPAVQGMITYWWRRLRGGPRRLIEYKGAGS